MLASFEEQIKNLPGLPKIEPPQNDPREHLPGIMGNDPMSPYSRPTSQAYFHDIAEVINKKPFKATFPQSYTPVSTYFTKNGITPYFNPGPDSDYAKGMITVAGMIELTNQGKPWALERDQDIELVITIAQQYLDVVKSYMNDQRIRAYAGRVERFLAVMEQGRSRMYRRHGKLNPFAIDFAALLRRFIRGGAR